MTRSRIYLDNAATSWPKPAAVPSAISDFYLNCGGAAGRGDYASSRQASEIVERCRQRIRQLFSARESDGVVLTHNGTDSLNTAIHGILRPGDHVVATVLEHNSVLRPLYHWRDHHGVEVDFVGPDEDGAIVPAKLANLVSEKTRLVCLNCASNVSGSVQDVRRLVQTIRPSKAFVLLDASQTAGKRPIDFQSLDCDMLAAAGHKGLFGPLGTGLLLLNDRAAAAIAPWRQGGTGGQSELETQPLELPSRLEAGNLDVGNIAGLAAGISFLLETGIDQIQKHESVLDEYLRQRLSSIRGATVVGGDTQERIAVCSLVFPEHDVHEIASILDANFGIEVRAGLHCAPMAAGSLSGSTHLATLRISPGWYNTSGQIDLVAEAISEIIGSTSQ